MMTSRLALALAAICFAFSAQANYTVDYVSAHCDPVEQKMELHAASIEDEDEQLQTEEERRVAPYHNVSAPNFVLVGDDAHNTEGTCAWSNGTRVLVHFGQRPDKEGMWISIWVNTSKWLGPEVANKEFPGYEPGQARSVTSVVITPSGMTVCSIAMTKTGSGSSAFYDDLSFGAESCEVAAATSFEQGADIAQFPGGKQRPPPYTELVRQSRNDKLCNSLVDPREQPMSDVSGGSGIWLYSPPLLHRIRLYGDQAPEVASQNVPALPSFLKPIAIDLENKGRVQPIIPISSGSHAEDNDRLYVYSAAGLKKLGASPGPEQDFERLARYVIPWVWLGCYGKENAIAKTANIGRCRDDSVLPFVARDFDGHSVSFRSRYLHIDPFEYERSTYLILTTLDRERRIAFVVKPLRNGKYEQICTLEAIRPNF